MGSLLTLFLFAICFVALLANQTIMKLLEPIFGNHSDTAPRFTVANVAIL